jgi:hypothetical protein
MRKRQARTAADVSDQLLSELEEALGHPQDIFGYGRYGDGEQWSHLDMMTGGLQDKTLAVMAARPKRGKSMLVAGWVPLIAEQASERGEVVRVVTLEMQRKSYQRRMAAIRAQIKDPMNIRRGKLTPEEVVRYKQALMDIASLPIQYLSNEEDLDEDEALQLGNSGVTFKDIKAFIEGRADPDGYATYWWVVDHIGLISDLTPDGNVTTSIYSLANKLANLAHREAAGMVITHLTRASTGGMPTIESIAGSDQVGRNADQIFLLSRPFMDLPDLTEEQQEQLKEGEPGFLQFFSRDEGSGIDTLWWDRERATFRELVVPEGVELPMPKKANKK